MGHYADRLIARITVPIFSLIFIKIYNFFDLENSELNKAKMNEIYLTRTLDDTMT